MRYNEHRQPLQDCYIRDDSIRDFKYNGERNFEAGGLTKVITSVDIRP